MVSLLPGRARVAPRSDTAGAAVPQQVRRPALDGIRALAVAGVLAYHLGGGSTSVVRGGFLGVDVFFVLSGYLITGLLLAEHRRSGRIDLVAFWFRRARRLLPALVVVVVAVGAWVWWSQAPETWPARRADLLWTLAYGTNWHLAATGQDYFAGYTGASPVLHTWSLAIEEQFYLAWPLLVIAGIAAGRLLRHGRSRLLLGAGAVGLAAAWSAWTLAAAWSPADASRAYYGTQGRVQELLVGALAALLGPALAALPAAVAGRAAAIGAAGLAAAMLAVPAEGPLYFRGGALGVSLLAAALVVGVERAPGCLAARALAWRPAVALGAVSYGVYLWHWPVVLAVPLPDGGGLPDVARTQLGRLLLVALLAALSWRFVERPALEGRLPLVGRSRRRFLALGLPVYAAAAAAAVGATALPDTLATQLADRADRSCPAERLDVLQSCVKVDAGAGAPVLALLGDSTARALAPGLDAEAGRRGFTWVQAAWQRCSATGLLVVPDGSDAPDAPALTCAEQATRAVDATLDRYRPDVVLVAETWSHDQDVIVDGVRAPAGSPAHRAALVRTFTELVDRVAARGGRTVLLELPPRGASLGESLARGRPAATPRPADPTHEARLAFDADLAAVAAARPHAASVVSVTDVLCPDPARCPALIGGMLARTDGIHYTGAYARVLAPILLDRIAATPAGAALAIERVRAHPSRYSG
ncbi:MAG TPA: acyltransferase family protein [Kineosporiaceae bacterium]|nr:acyltransferase family protein [Kineosporiaceae bacterium]